MFSVFCFCMKGIAAEERIRLFQAPGEKINSDTITSSSWYTAILLSPKSYTNSEKKRFLQLGLFNNNFFKDFSLPTFRKAFYILTTYLSESLSPSLP